MGHKFHAFAVHAFLVLKAARNDCRWKFEGLKQGMMKETKSRLKWLSESKHNKQRVKIWNVHVSQTTAFTKIWILSDTENFSDNPTLAEPRRDDLLHSAVKMQKQKNENWIGFVRLVDVL